ncbi:MAG: TetR family transcriptional regulator [Acidobacteriota bacterium]
MGKLIDKEKRELARRKRATRKERILAEARKSFERLPFVDVSMDSIGHAAKVDRGVASMYFKSKEGIFLLLLKDELDEWLSALAVELEQNAEPRSARELACILAESLAARPRLTRFLSLAPVVFEQNLEVIEVFRFQRWRRDRMVEVGEMVDAAAGPGRGGGARLLHLIQLIAAGLEPLAHPKGTVAYELADPDFAMLRIDLREELESLIAAFLEPAR